MMTLVRPGKLPRGEGVKEAAAAAETFPTPMEEPRKVIKAWYLGSQQVNAIIIVIICHICVGFICIPKVSNPGGMDTVNAAIAEKMETVRILSNKETFSQNTDKNKLISSRPIRR